MNIIENTGRIKGTPRLRLGVTNEGYGCFCGVTNEGDGCFCSATKQGTACLSFRGDTSNYRNSLFVIPSNARNLLNSNHYKKTRYAVHLISGFLCSPYRTVVGQYLLVALFARYARRPCRLRRRTVGLLGAARTRSFIVGLRSLFLGSHFHFLLSYLRKCSLCGFARFIHIRSIIAPL